eukprot:Em1054g1a
MSSACRVCTCSSFPPPSRPGKPLVFGVDLDELTLGSSHKVPFIVRKIVEYIEENVGNADFSSVDTATVGGLLKLWLVGAGPRGVVIRRELPTPVIPDEVVPDFVQIQETNVGHASPERLAQLREAIHKLPKPNFELLKYLIRHLIKVTEHSSDVTTTTTPPVGTHPLHGEAGKSPTHHPLNQSPQRALQAPPTPGGGSYHLTQHKAGMPGYTGWYARVHRLVCPGTQAGKPLVFGVSLERLNLSSSDKVPFIVRKIVEHIEENGLSEQGLYRVNGNTRLINDLRNIFDKREMQISHMWTQPLLDLLKLWLRELPTPVIPDEVVPDFVQIQETNVGHASPEQLAQLREAIHKLPKPNFELLKYLIRHLIKVTEHS